MRTTLPAGRNSLPEVTEIEHLPGNHADQFCYIGGICFKNKTVKKDFVSRNVISICDYKRKRNQYGENS